VREKQIHCTKQTNAKVMDFSPTVAMVTKHQSSVSIVDEGSSPGVQQGIQMGEGANNKLT
jgi:hypothetical protein